MKKGGEQFGGFFCYGYNRNYFFCVHEFLKIKKRCADRKSLEPFDSLGKQWFLYLVFNVKTLIVSC